MNKKTIVATKPSPWYQLLMSLIVLSVFVVLPVFVTFRRGGEEQLFQVIALMVATVSFCYLVWSLIRGPEMLTWKLSEVDLQRGKKKVNLSISFSEIELIRIGLPNSEKESELDWFFQNRKLKMLKKMERSFRGKTLFLRLKGNRMFLLNLSSGQFFNGEALMVEFINLNASKVHTSTFTYTEEEYENLTGSEHNQIINLN